MKTLKEVITVMCDECDNIYGDYVSKLDWDCEAKLFRCEKHPEHTEDIVQALRTQDEHGLYELVADLLLIFPKPEECVYCGKCEWCGTINKSIEFECLECGQGGVGTIEEE